MKALATISIVLGFLALGVFGLMQFRNIGEYEEEVARREEPDPGYRSDPASRAIMLQESRDMLALSKNLRLGGGIGGPLLLIGGAVMLRRRRTTA